jgi:syndecan 1
VAARDLIAAREPYEPPAGRAAGRASHRSDGRSAGALADGRPAGAPVAADPVPAGSAASDDRPAAGEYARPTADDPEPDLEHLGLAELLAGAMAAYRGM